MNYREQLIKEFLDTPLQEGESVSVKGLSFKDKERGVPCTIVKINNKKGTATVLQNEYKETAEVPLTDIIERGKVFHLGFNPFSAVESKVRYVNFTFESILHAIGYDKTLRTMRTEKFVDVEVPELNWNPVLKNSDGKDVSFQRGFVWSDSDNSLLIASIVKGLDCGRIIVRKRSFEWVESQIKQGNLDVGFKDIVDGKQRLNAILKFVTDQFKFEGYYFSEWSRAARNKFFNFQGIGYGELDERSTDEDVKQTFLMNNFAGVVMSKEHIEYVKSIEL